jgi:DNA-binding LacI/PurR family transcriptional regulator
VLVGAPHHGESYGVPCVFTNHEFGGYLVAQHLIGLSHRRIAICDDDSGLLIATMRGRGYLLALLEAKKARITVEYETIGPEIMQTFREDPPGAARWIRRAGGPTAIIAWNDERAMQLISLLTRAGITVPAELSITGFDNLPIGCRNHPYLTTVETGLEQQMEAAIALLTAPLAPAPDSGARFGPKLVVRESTAPPRDD